MFLLSFYLMAVPSVSITRTNDNCTITVDKLKCPVFCYDLYLPKLLKTEAVNKQVYIVNYSLEMEQGTSCMIVEHMGLIVDLAANKCLGEFNRKYVTNSKDSACTDVDQPVWTVKNDSIHIVEEFAEVDELIKFPNYK